MKNRLLDASIFWSFDRSGFLRHQREFREELRYPPGAHALITGGTSGLGEACARELLGHGVSTTVTGRDVRKGEVLAQSLKGVSFKPLDLTAWEEIERLVGELPALDYLVLNAGGMPESFQTNRFGVELQFASQLFGHYILAVKLLAAGKLKSQARIVWVTSGGMYLKPLDPETVFRNPRYDKVATYANVKRAQVELLPYFARRFPQQIVTAMHPGWAATPGVAQSIPGFSRLMEGRLRTPREGADTILWLLSSTSRPDSGGLYFDRRRVPEHLFWFTRGRTDAVNELEGLVEKFSQEV